MSKKILIINKSFELGGIQTALSNMLKVLQDEYEITLAIFNSNGPFKERVPDNVRLLKLSPFVEVLGMSNSDCKKYGTFSQKLFKLTSSVWAKIFGNTLPVKFAFAFQENVGEYDAVISYHQETSAKTMVTGFGKFALEKCKSPMKITWVHADFLGTKLATKKNLKTYEKFDKIVCVSKTCENNFVTAYPSLKEKCSFCYNYMPSHHIINKSNEKSNVFERNENTTILFSACRLAKEKGLVNALEALLPLWKNGYDLKWYIAGEGTEREKIETIIQENNLKENVILLGYKNNPYPYIKEADYLFLPSLHEAFSMVVAEAHILNTPIISSDIPIMQEVAAEADILCKDGDFASLIKSIKKRKSHSYDIISASDWKKEFGRVIGI